MAVFVDLECDKCGTVLVDQWSDKVGTKHKPCGGRMLQLWSFSSAAIQPGTHDSEATFVYKSDKEGGKIQYPGRNDVPVPDRLRARGYEKVKINVRDMAAFEKRNGVTNERRHFDRNGRGLEG